MVIARQKNLGRFHASERREEANTNRYCRQSNNLGESPVAKDGEVIVNTLGTTSGSTSTTSSVKQSSSSSASSSASGGGSVGVSGGTGGEGSAGGGGGAGEGDDDGDKRDEYIDGLPRRQVRTTSTPL